MNLQYIHDNHGNATGVFIPIEEWQLLKKKYDGLQQEELKSLDIPEWHKKVLDERLEDYHKNPDNSVDFEVTMKSVREKFGL